MASFFHWSAPCPQASCPSGQNSSNGMRGRETRTKSFSVSPPMLKKVDTAGSIVYRKKQRSIVHSDTDEHSLRSWSLEYLSHVTTMIDSRCVRFLSLLVD